MRLMRWYDSLNECQAVRRRMNERVNRLQRYFKLVSNVVNEITVGVNELLWKCNNLMKTKNGRVNELL